MAIKHPATLEKGSVEGVEQCDRDAAADYLNWHMPYDAQIRGGEHDDHGLEGDGHQCQRHRNRYRPGAPMNAFEMREAAAKVADSYADEWQASGPAYKREAGAVRCVAKAIRAIPIEEAASRETIERVAIAMWIEEARRAAPNVAKYRNADGFREQPDTSISAWLGLAAAALAAMNCEDNLYTSDERAKETADSLRVGAREMVAGDIGMGPLDILTRRIVDAIFADLRDRRFLKYLFAEDPENQGGYGQITSPFDLDLQREIHETWQGVVRAALNAEPRP